MKYLIHLIILTALLSGCKDDKIAKKEHYNIYLQDDNVVNRQVRNADTEIDFWQKRLQRDTGNYVDMMELAYQYNYRFKLTGLVTDLAKADSFMLRSSEKLAHSNPDILFNRAQTAITMHRFREAYDFNTQATNQGGAQYISNLLSFDAGFEMGLYKQSYKKLNQLKDKKAIDYLIRKSKEEDHKGNLDGAIELIEEVLEKAEAMDHPSLINWARSTLGDMYGHAGRVKDAYDAYLQVLEDDPGFMYALKGIAWIAYSHDQDTEEANRIINYIHSQTRMPDLFLLQAEMAEYNGDQQVKAYYTQKFISEVSASAYGDMYNKYLIELYGDDPKLIDKALALAIRELQHRSTPETYDWYVWALFKKGEYEKAYEIAAKHVYNETSEPNAMMHTAFIFDKNGKKDIGKKLLSECLESSFELGPVTTAHIKNELPSL